MSDEVLLRCITFFPRRMRYFLVEFCSMFQVPFLPVGLSSALSSVVRSCHMTCPSNVPPASPQREMQNSQVLCFQAFAEVRFPGGWQMCTQSEKSVSQCVHLQILFFPLDEVFSATRRSHFSLCVSFFNSLQVPFFPLGEFFQQLAGPIFPLCKVFSATRIFRFSRWMSHFPSG